MQITYVATCLLGVEGILKNELIKLGADEVCAKNGRVYFKGNYNILARTNICSRYSERILINLKTFKATNFEEIFENVKQINWSYILPKNAMFPVVGSSINSQLKSIPSLQSVIKKAIVKSLSNSYRIDWFKEDGPLYKVQFFILKDEVNIMLDTTGSGLYKRGYKKNCLEAPIRETLAAAIVNLARVDKSTKLIDPFCGSGVILIEGALKAMNKAPGINRKFISQEWENFSNKIWHNEYDRARDLEIKKIEFEAFGFDNKSKAIKLAKQNALNAGVLNSIQLHNRDFKQFKLVEYDSTLVCNPPYGERMLNKKKARDIYKLMGKKFIKQIGKKYYIISSDDEFEKCFGRRSDKRRKLYNGMLKCNVYMYFK